MLVINFNRPFFKDEKWSIFLISFLVCLFAKSQDNYKLYSSDNEKQITEKYKALIFQKDKSFEIESDSTYQIKINNIKLVDSIFINLKLKYYKVEIQNIKSKKIYIDDVEDLTEIVISTQKHFQEFTLKSFSNRICQVRQGTGKKLNLINLDTLKGNYISSLELFIKKQPKKFRFKTELKIGIQLGSVSSLDDIEVNYLDEITIKKIKPNFNGWLEFDIKKLSVPRDAKYLAIVVYFYDSFIIIPCPSYKSMREQIFIPTIYRPIKERGRIIEDKWLIYNENMEYPTSNPYEILPLKINTTNF